MKVEIEISQPRMKGKQDSFWYEGCIATAGDLELVATGEIRIRETATGDRVSWEDIARKAKTDRGLYKLVGNEDSDKPYYWDMNNWFELFGGDMGYDYGVYHSYDEALDALRITALTHDRVNGLDC